MKNYQLAVLADPDIVDESAEEIKNKIIASVQNEGGLVISSSKTEKRKLGHPIKGKISASHGNKGIVRAIFEKGLPGQAITMAVKIE